MSENEVLWTSGERSKGCYESEIAHLRKVNAALLTACKQGRLWLSRYAVNAMPGTVEHATISSMDDAIAIAEQTP